ncbi:tRNA pseudouridine(38-40) synthase TruA [bacterium]|nr:tRNA pseudouridine(38-40) synthase TruA [bacterium]
MKNLLLKIEYLGKHFCGWQIQPNAITIEGTIKEVLEKICQCQITLKACSRTDSGVHAKGQVATAQVPETIKLNRLFISLNALLPENIAVTDLVEVPAEFSVRRGKKRKRYTYRIINSPIPRVFYRDTSIWKRTRLDKEKLHRAIKLFEGTHDFSAFRGKGCQQPNPVKTIYRVDLKITEEDGFEKIELMFEGSGFLKNMVRIMAGTLIDISQGRIAESRILKAFETGNRNDAGNTAPAKGLTLEEIIFDIDPFSKREMDAWNKTL